MIGNVVVKSKKREVQQEFLRKAQKVLEEIGLTAESQSKLITPVDTGNLRNSITHETHELTVYIGTNVEYGKYVEAWSHFLRDTIQGHLGQYRVMIDQEFKS